MFYRCNKEIHNENGTDYPNLEEEYPNEKEWIVTNATKRMDIDRKRVCICVMLIY